MNDTFRKILFKTIILFGLFSLPTIAESQVFVKYDAQGANNGTSWADAYTNLDSAINRTTSGEIWVAAGTYTPSITFPYTSYKTFNITKNISLFGGFKGNETSLGQRNIDNNPTILSGDVGVAGYDPDNTPKVIAIAGSNIDSTTIIDGFTVTKSYYTNGSGYDNAAVYITTYYPNPDANPIIRNCTIKDNFGFDGAGIYVTNAKPLIINNLITNNIAFQGAGVYLAYGGNAKVMSNKITNNKCVGGYTHLSGGGIQIDAYCAPFIYGNLIDNNQSGTYGGGISVESNYSAVIANNIISNNTSRDGGGIYINFTATQVINNLIIDNKATGSGGGMYVDYSFASRSVNNTIVNNSSDNYGGAIYTRDCKMELTNTIIFKNPTKFGKQFHSLNANRTDWWPKFEYCNVENGAQGITYSDPSKISSIWGAGNISDYPNFVDTTNSNYQLRPSSPCVNMGKPDTTGLWLPATDVIGRKRFLGATVDMGCYEYDSSFINTDSLIVSPAIINADGRADSSLSLDVKSSTNWSVTSKPDWVRIDSMSGANNAIIPITIIANPSLSTARSGKINFSRPGILPLVQVTINQSASGYLVTTPDTIYVSSQQNDTTVFNISSNLSWYLTGYPSWLSFNKYYSSGNATIVAKAIENPTGSSRTAQVFVYSNNYTINPPISRRVVIIQLPTYLIICPNGGASLLAGFNSASYQWQVDSGSGFVDISDNSYYTGSNSKLLKLTNIPSSFYGYKYRCVSGNVNGNVFTLKVRNEWTGAAGNEWENPLNWTCGALPDSNTDVIVARGNAIVNSNTSIRSLLVSAPGSTTVAQGANLTILQSGIGPDIVVNPSKLNVPSDGGKRDTITVSSNVKWTISMSAGTNAWVTTNKVSDTAGTTKVIFNYAANTNGSSRAGTIYFNNNGYIPYAASVALLQEQPNVAIGGFTPHAAGGATITIYGSGFSSIISQNKVLINGVPASVTSASSTVIQAIVPVKAGTGFISVTVNGKSVTSTSEFVYDLTGVVTVLAGGTEGYSDGTGTAAKFTHPAGLDIDPSGNLYVADYANYKVRKVTPSGVVTTLPGRFAPWQNPDGPSTNYDLPQDVVVDELGNFYVVEANAHAISKISKNGTVTLVTGGTASGYNDGPASSALFNRPTGIIVDPSGDIIVADMGNNRLRRINSAATVSTIAGSQQGYAEGQGTSAMFNMPFSVIVDINGNYLLSDYYNNRVRKITTAGAVTTFAGSGGWGSADGSLQTAEIYHPTDLAKDATGNIYVCDGNSKIRMITVEGKVKTITPSITLSMLQGIAVDASGVIYVSDYYNNRICKLVIQ